MRKLESAVHVEDTCDQLRLPMSRRRCRLLRIANAPVFADLETYCQTRARFRPSLAAAKDGTPSGREDGPDRSIVVVERRS
jgi:hypothetical protein